MERAVRCRILWWVRGKVGEAGLRVSPRTLAFERRMPWGVVVGWALGRWSVRLDLERVRAEGA
jgi:hypothetical protein